MRSYWVTIKQNMLTIGAYIRLLTRRLNGRIVWLFGSSALVAIALALPIVASGNASQQATNLDSQAIPQVPPPAISPAVNTHKEQVMQTQASAQSHSSAGESQSTQAKLRVNGQTITLPENGSVHKQITSAGGTTNLDVSIQSASSGSDTTNTSSSSSLTVQTTTESSTDSTSEVSGP